MELEQKAVEMIDKLAVAIEQAARPAADLALQAVQLQAIVSLAGALLALIAGAALLRIGYRNRDDWGDVSIPCFVFGGCSMIGGFMLAFANLIAAINPAAALALRVIDAVS